MIKHSNYRDHTDYKKLYKHQIIRGEAKRNNIKYKRGVIKGPVGIDKCLELVNQRSRI